jgi:hypothetical protein
VPDITLCFEPICPLKDRCYRALAKPNQYQSYSNFIYENGCEYFWDIKEEK